MPIIVGHRRLIGDIAGELARLESLVSALERFGNGELPTARELKDAPLISPFTMGTLHLPCLVGGNINHPVRTGPIIRTSELWVMAPQLGWARTYSRLYRLGERWLPGTGS